ncbi:MAG: type II toxin-antitoxin system VapC family toxin [Pacificimonas sp.]
MIVVDTSALMAVLLDETTADECKAILLGGEPLAMSAGTYHEALIVARSRGVDAEMKLLIDIAGIDIVPFDANTARRAADAYDRWGKGNHPARLNICDTHAYALAAETGGTLLFVGDDFAKTDIPDAMG